MDKSIIGYPNYSISEVGEVRNIGTGRKLKWTETNGYLAVTLYKNRKGKTNQVHRLIYQTFVGEIPKGLVVDHIDCDPSNNTLSNLRLVTYQQNAWNTKKTKGYYFDKHASKWHAQITVNGERKYLGLFDTEEEARAEYLKAKNIYHVIE